MSADRGLSGSRWAPVNTGRPPYYWSTSKIKKRDAASSVTSASTSAQTTTTTTTAKARASPSLPPAATPTPAGTTNGKPPVAHHPTSSSPSDTACPAPYQADASALRRIPTPWAELGRFIKIARRMRWKLPFLAHGYRAATDRTSDERDEAELMFKLDFFEYYSLLERALVHLMGVFGVKVTGALLVVPGAGVGVVNGGGANGARGQRRQQSQSQTQSSHRFHANVLEALDDPRNPLHGVLGGDEARSALARAKELRNRWKNADDDDHLSSGNGARASRPLEDYDLERVLDTIFGGFEEAYEIAECYVADVRALGAADGSGGGGMDMDADAGDDAGDDPADEAQWEFIVDAMDWTT